MQERTGVRALKFIAADLIGDFGYFPVWWETHGVARQAKKSLARVRGSWIRLGLGVWLKNLFVPMYGQYDLSGRLVSFFMRFFQIILRSIAFIILFALNATAVLLWIVAPIAVVVMIMYALGVPLW